MSGCTLKKFDKVQSTISGVVQAGRVSNATVTVYTVKNGQRDQSLGETTTDSEGSFSLDVEKQSSPVEVVAKKGSYKDEATGQTVIMGENELTTVLENTDAPQETPITPITTQVSERVKTLSETGSITDSQFGLARSAVLEEVAQMFGVTKDVITSIPNKPDAPGDPQSDAGKGAYLLATLSQYFKDKDLGPDKGVNPFDAFKELAKDIKNDGKLDGTDNGTPVSATFAALNTDWANGMSSAAENLKTNDKVPEFSSFDKTAMNIGQFKAEPENKIATVSSAAQAQVTICHIPPGHPENDISITIGESAVAAHLEHGDSLGSCPVTPPTNISISIDGNAAYTSSTSVTLTLNATGAWQMYITNISGCGSGGSWEPYSSSKAWTLGQTNSTATAYVKYRDLAQNESACINDTIIHENQAPTGESLSINSNATYTSSTSVSLTLAATGASEMCVTNNAGCSCANPSDWESYSATKSWTLGQTNSTATVYVKYRDAAHNETACINDTIIHDDQAPTGESITINSNATHTKTTSVTLILAATGASQMCITNTAGCTCSNPSDWENFSAAKAWTLSQTNTTATVYVKYRDGALNESGCVSDTIIHDDQAPTGEGIVINSNATYATSSSVALTLAATGASEMCVTNTSGCSCANPSDWESYSATKNWTLGQTNSTATVYVKYRDVALNETACINETIIHDDQAPTGGSIAINNGDASTTSTSVTLNLSASGATDMYVTNNSDCATGGTSYSYNTSQSWTLGQTNGTATVYVKFFDAAGNASGCLSDTITHIVGGGSWVATSVSGVPSARTGHSSVWTGSKMIVWGGHSPYTNTGEIYDPVTDSWVVVESSSAPSERTGHASVWTGSKMIIWGGMIYNSGVGTSYLRDGGAYDPVADSWSAVASTNSPSGTVYTASVWTGSKMIVWGGFGSSGTVSTGASYDPIWNSWSSISAVGAPSARNEPTTVWTGKEMIVWGGDNGYPYFNTGGRYNPETDVWTSTTTTGAPSNRENHTAVWTGSKMIVWGGWNGNNFLASGSAYDPIADSWQTISNSDAPNARSNHVGVWTGARMLIWGGTNYTNTTTPASGQDMNTGGLYDPTNNSWEPMSTDNAPVARAFYYSDPAVWTGSKMIVWGGATSMTPSSFFNTGGVYTPPVSSTSNSWTATSGVSAPTNRYKHTSIWTGAKMIIWGGLNNSATLATGASYDPITDAWSAVSDTGAPAARREHSAVWTGSKMIVWGGNAPSSYLSSGGVYDPALDTWATVTTTGAPSARRLHSAVWTGSKMVLWGGDTGSGTNTGGVYDLQTNSWTVVTTTGAPTGRYGHSAIWTGSKMVVWGGTSNLITNTGGVYDPQTDIWTTTSLVNSPAARTEHTAIWTGSKMIVWGGWATNIVHDSGASYDPTTDNWTTISTSGSPSPRSSHVSLWTGSKMIIWGGYGESNAILNTGDLYDPQSDSWVSMTTVGAPSGRYYFSAIWTGAKMIAWGGQVQGITGGTATGGIYEP